jgi:hypothetical protein
MGFDPFDRSLKIQKSIRTITLPHPLLARALARPCFGRKFKARVVTLVVKRPLKNKMIQQNDTLLNFLGFAIKIQLHATHATANLCSCIRQVAHDI